MPPRYQNRTVVAYAMHGRTVDAVIDYPQFFALLSSRTVRDRTIETAENVVALADVREQDGRYVLRLLTGSRGDTPVLFDIGSGSEREADVAEREVVANATSVVVDPRSRFFVIERRRPGVPVDIIEVLMTRLGRSLFGQSFAFTLTPVASEDFVNELDAFERIRRTEIELARPNFDWDDNAARLAELAAESHADTMSVAATASRGGSLATESGIVHDAKELASNRIGPVKNIRVTGRRADETVERVLTFSKHVLRRIVQLPFRATSAEKRRIVEQAATEFVEFLSAGTADGPREQQD